MKKLLQITLLLAGLAWCVPAHAIFANTQHKSATGGLGTSLAVGTFTAIPTGSLIVATQTNDQNTTQVVASAGASGAGTWIIPSTCTGTSAACNKSDPGNSHNMSVQYILSSINTPTSITCTASAGIIAQCAVDTVTFTSGPVSVDVGTTTTRTSASNQPGLSPGTLTGSNDVIIQWGVTSSTLTACSGTTNLFAAGCTAGEFPNGNGNAILINTASNTAGSWTNAAAGTIAEGALAFKESAVATVRTMPPAVY